MDVTRLIEEVREKCAGIQITAEEVYMAPTFLEFHNMVILRYTPQPILRQIRIRISFRPRCLLLLLDASWKFTLERASVFAIRSCLKDWLTFSSGRHGAEAAKFEFDAITMTVNNMTIRFPHQLFINNQFVDSVSGKTFKTVNPSTEEVFYISHLKFAFYRNFLRALTKKSAILVSPSISLFLKGWKF